MFSFETVERKKVKLKIGLTGPSGAGKTYSAIQLAKGIASSGDKIAFLDTENGSAAYYSHLAKFKHENFKPPYTPERFIEAIEYCVGAGFEVMVVDSISHEWAGKGGCLEMVELVKAQHNIKMDMQAWKYITPKHNAFIDALRDSDIHLIGCIRSKQEYELEKNDRGKVEVKKLGLKGVQREGMDYEFGVVFDVNMSHFASSSKDRTSLFTSREPFQITPETGKELMAWADEGAEEMYTGTNAQKVTFATICKEFEISDPKAMLAMSEKLSGNVAMSELKTKIKEELDNGTE